MRGGVLLPGWNNNIENHAQVIHDVSVQGVDGAARFVLAITYFAPPCLSNKVLTVVSISNSHGVSSDLCALDRSCGRSQFWLSSAVIRASALRSESSLKILFMPRIRGRMGAQKDP